MVEPQFIADALTEERSKASVNRVIHVLEKEGLDFAQFFDFLSNTPFPLRWYMTWVLTHYIEQNPDIGNKNQQLIWKELKTNDNQSMLRDLWRSMTFIEIDEELAGDVYDAAVKTLMSAKNAIAVRAHAMYCAANIAKPYSELCHELILLLEEFKLEESAGLKARAQNLSKQLSRNLRKAI
jgi:hypothetical protein